MQNGTCVFCVRISQSHPCKIPRLRAQQLISVKVTHVGRAADCAALISTCARSAPISSVCAPPQHLARMRARRQPVQPPHPHARASRGGAKRWHRRQRKMCFATSDTDVYFHFYIDGEFLCFKLESASPLPACAKGKPLHRTSAGSSSDQPLIPPPNIDSIQHHVQGDVLNFPTRTTPPPRPPPPTKTLV